MFWLRFLAAALLPVSSIDFVPFATRVPGVFFGEHSVSSSGYQDLCFCNVFTQFAALKDSERIDEPSPAFNKVNSETDNLRSK
jgi:hypothetical protein